MAQTTGTYTGNGHPSQAKKRDFLSLPSRPTQPIPTAVHIEPSPLQSINQSVPWYHSEQETSLSIIIDLLSLTYRLNLTCSESLSTNYDWESINNTFWSCFISINYIYLLWLYTLLANFWCCFRNRLYSPKCSRYDDIQPFGNKMFAFTKNVHMLTCGGCAWTLLSQIK